MAKNLGKIDDIDTRVVEMQFDNKQFEKGASTTLSTLEKLKAALKFDGVNKGFDSLQKSINSVNFNNLTLQLSSTEEAFTTFAGALKRNFFDEISNWALDLGKKIYNATTGQIISGGKSRAQKIAQAKFKMGGMDVDWDKISDDLDYAVSGTAYGLDAAASIASQLVASGVEVGDSMKTALRGVSGVAAMTSSSYEEIGNIFASVAGQGKAMAMQLNQLSLRGINAASTIAEYLNTTEAEVRDLASKGEISFKIFAEAMDDAFGEHAKKANDTFKGAFENIQAALSRIGELFWSPFYDSMITPLNTLRETIVMFKNALTGSVEGIDTKFGLRTTAERLKQIVEVLGDIANLLLKGIQNGLKGMFKYLQPVNRVMVTWLHNLKEVRSWLQSIIPDDTTKKIDKVKDSIEGITEAEIQMAKDIWYKGSYGNGIDRVVALGEHYKVVQAYINDFINSNYKWADSVKKVGDAHNKYADPYGDTFLDHVKYNLGSIVQSIKLNLIPTIVNLYNVAKTVLKTVKESFIETFFKYDPNDSRLESLLWVVTYSLKKFSEAITLTETDVKNLRSTFDGFFKLISIGTRLINEILDRIAPLFGEFKKGDSALLHITGSIGEFISALHETLVYEGGIYEFFKIATELAGNMIFKLDKFFKKLFSISIIDWFDSLKYAIKDVGKVFENKGIREGFKYIKNNVTSLVHIDLSKIGKVVGGVVELFKEIFDNASKFFKSVPETFKKIFSVFTDFADFIKLFIKRAKMFISGDLSGLLSSIDTSVPTGVANTFNDALTSFVGTLTTTLNNLVGELNKIDPNAVQSAVNKTSKTTTSVVGFIRTSSKDIKGVDKDAKNIVDTIKEISGAVTGLLFAIDFYKIGAGIQSFGAGVKAIGSAMGEAVNLAKEAVIPFAKAEAFKRITEGLKNLALTVVSLLAAILLFAVIIDKFEIATRAVVLGIVAASVSMLSLAGAMLMLSKVSVGVLPTVAGLMVSMSLLLGEFIILTLLFFKFSASEEQMHAFLDALRNATVTIGIITTMILTLFSAFMALTIAMAKTTNGKITSELSTTITAFGGVLKDVAKSVVILLGAVLLLTWMFSKFDEDYIWKSFAMVAIFTMVMAGAVAGIMAASGKLAQETDAKTLENLHKLLDSIASFIKGIIGSIVVLFALTTLASVFGMADEFVISLGLMLAIMTAMIGALYGITKMVSSSEVTAEKLKAVSDILNAMWKFVLAVSVSLSVMSVIANKFGKANMWNSVFALLVASVGLVAGFVALLGGTYSSSSGGAGYSKTTSIFGSLFKTEKNIAASASKSQGISKNALKLVKELTVFILAVAAAISVVAVVTKLVGSENMGQAFATIAGTIATMLLLTYMILQAGNVDTEKLKAVSWMFVAIGGAVLAISAGFAILSLAIASINDGEKLGTVVGALATIVAIMSIATLLIFTLSTLDIKESENLSKVLLSVTAVFAGMAAIIAATSLVISAVSKAPDPIVVAEIFAGLTGMIVSVSTFIMILAALGKTDWKPIVSAGAGLGIAFVAMAGALLAVGYIIHAIKEYNISSQLFADISLLILSMGGIVVAITSVVGALGPMSLLGLVALGGGLLEFGIFLYALSELDWNKIAQALGILDTYTSTIWQVILMILSLVGISVLGGAASLSMISIAAGITAIALAMMLFAKAVYMLKRACDGFDPWSSVDTSHVANTYYDASSSEAVRSGESTGEAYAEGIVNGVDDHQADIYNAGANAGKAMVTGTKDETQINSPSKVGYSIGAYYVEGIDNALIDGQDPLAEHAAMLGRSMSTALENELETVNVSDTVASGLTDNMSDSLVDSINSDAVADAWGDFAMDSYSDYFDDAPMEANVSPIIEADEMEAEVASDPLDGIQDSLSGLLANSDTTATSLSSLTGEGGLIDELKAMFAEATAATEEKDEQSLWDKAKETLRLDKNALSTQSLTEGFTSAIGSIELPKIDFDQTSLLNKFDTWLGTGGIFGSVEKIYDYLTGSSDGVVTDVDRDKIKKNAKKRNIDYDTLHYDTNGWAMVNDDTYVDSYDNFYQYVYGPDGQLHMTMI